jgi:hypothetical protein
MISVEAGSTCNVSPCQELVDSLANALDEPAAGTRTHRSPAASHRSSAKPICRSHPAAVIVRLPFQVADDDDESLLRRAPAEKRERRLEVFEEGGRRSAAIVTHSAEIPLARRRELNSNTRSCTTSGRPEVDDRHL